jgi:rubrerythrin
MSIRHSNRIKSTRASISKYWCMSCDGALVGDYGKCPRCGKRNKPKRKKQSRTRERIIEDL